MSSFLFHSVSSKHPSGENKHSFGSGDEGGIDGKDDNIGDGGLYV